jgi:hypothetical protein
MAITFRGQASRLNKETKGRNQVGFQDKSAAGDRQGVGGEDVSLKQAMGSFNKRNTSPAKKSCSPITARAKNSPLKMNQALVDGAANTNKEFVDVGAIVGGALNQPDKKAKGKTADLAPKAPKEKGKTLDAPKAKKIDTNLGATNPLDNMEAPILEF